MNEIEILIPGPAGNVQLKYQEGSHAQLFVMCHPHPLYQGSMDNKVVSMAVKASAEMGFSTLRFNYRGVGKSQGTYGEGEGEAADLMAVVAWAKDHLPVEALYLGGFSFGCYVAYRGAGTLHPRALLMIAPAVDHMNFQALPVPSVPYTVIQGEADEVVSAAATFKFVAEHPNSPLIKVERLPNVGHFFHGQLIPLKHLIQEFFKKNES